MSVRAELLITNRLNLIGTNDVVNSNDLILINLTLTFHLESNFRILDEKITVTYLMQLLRGFMSRIKAGIFDLDL